MTKKKKHILKKGGLEVRNDFTSSLMDKINTEEVALNKLLTKHGTKETSADFTTQIMAQLDGKTPKVPYTPVISKRVWIGIIAVFTGVIILALFSDTKRSRFDYSEEITSVTNTVRTFFSNRSLFLHVSMGILLLSIGLFLEQLWRKNPN